MYIVQKCITKLNNNQPTFFLDPKEKRLLENKLKSNEYKIYRPYKDSEKVIFYNCREPKVLLYEIKCKSKIRHQDILGSVYSLISGEMFGDIIIKDGHYYIYILELVRNYFESNFSKVKNYSVELESCPLELLSNYEREYEEFEIIVSSERIDTVISTITHINRNSIKDKIKNKDIMLNHDYLKSSSYYLKPGDIFSIRKYGKFKYIGIEKKTKKDNFIVKYLKYL